MRVSAELLQPLIKACQNKYNYERPHQSLNYLTPMKYFQKFERQGISTKEYQDLRDCRHWVGKARPQTAFGQFLR